MLCNLRWTWKDYIKEKESTQEIVICVLRLQAIWVHAQAHGTARLAPVEPCLVPREWGTGGKVLRSSVQRTQIDNCSFLLSTCLSWTTCSIEYDLWPMGSSTSTWFYAWIYGTIVSCLHILSWQLLMYIVSTIASVQQHLQWSCAWCDLVISASVKILSRPSASACFFTSNRWSSGNVGNICDLRRRPSPIQEQS